MTDIRGVIAADFDRILALNSAEVRQTSPMDRDQLRLLVAMSSYSRVAIVEQQVAAFLIALREGARYDSENYLWFATHYPGFLYVDRIVVGAAFSGLGIGSKLYADLFGFAGAQGIEIITCEYNLQPPNPASRVFHDKFGFREVGTQRVAGGTKLVSLQVAAVG